MKTLLALLLTALSLGAVTVTITWDPNDPAEQVTGYVVFQSTNVAGPFAPVALVPSTNAFLDLTPGNYFFYVVASNFWGISDPSATVSTPAVSGKVQGVNIKR